MIPESSEIGEVGCDNASLGKEAKSQSSVVVPWFNGGRGRAPRLI